MSDPRASKFRASCFSANLAASFVPNSRRSSLRSLTTGDNARKLVAFLLQDGNSDLSSVAPSRTSASVLRQLRALSPVVNERRDDLRLFGTKLAARLAEKQLARNFDALGSLIAPAASR